MDNESLMQLLRDAADAVEEAVRAFPEADREKRGHGHEDQFAVDVVADRAAVESLTAGGVGVLTEESGVHYPDRQVRVVVDPIDGSTNCSRGLDPYGPSFCAFDVTGPRAALVVNLMSGRCYTALRGVGAWCDDIDLTCEERGSVHLVATGDPIAHIQPRVWTRVSGASAHDLCRVADGTFDAYADDRNTVSIWDYAGAALILQEAGGVVVERTGKRLFDEGSPTGNRLLAAASWAQIERLQVLLGSHGRPPTQDKTG